MARMYDSAKGAIPDGATEILVPTDGVYAAGVPAVRAKFPNAKYQTYSALGQVVAEWIDCEPGCVWPPEAAAGVYVAWRDKGCRGIYTFISNMQAVKEALAARQVNINTVEFFDANYTGVDHVDPGYVETQFEDAGPYDITETTPALEAELAAPAPAPQPQPAQIGDNMILRDPQTGGVWVVAEPNGAIYAYDGAPFLGGTNSESLNPGNYKCVGICEFADPSGIGYELVLDWGSPEGNGKSADGGDQYRRYKFPRSGTGK